MYGFSYQNSFIVLSQDDTIQVALITNGVLSFTHLLYLNPTMSDGAQMGLNSGVVSGSLPLSHFTLPNMHPRGDNIWSNTGVPGEWFFRVDTTVALQPQRMYIHLNCMLNFLNTACINVYYLGGILL